MFPNEMKLGMEPRLARTTMSTKMEMSHSSDNQITLDISPKLYPWGILLCQSNRIHVTDVIGWMNSWRSVNYP